MYTRYIRGADGIYRRQLANDQIPGASAEASAATAETEPSPQPEPHAAPPANAAGGSLRARSGRQFAADDLLLAAIVLLLLIDGGDEDWVAVLAALAFLLF